MDIDELQQLEQKDLAPLREKLHKEQNYICPILNKKFKIEDMVVDHKHKRKGDPVGVNGDGLIRGVIHFQANAIEGKITNSFFRWGIHKHGISLSDFLRNLADYLDNKPLPLIHPNEKTKVVKKVLGKRLFAKIAKAYALKYPKRKPLEYPKVKTAKGKTPKPPALTAQWLKLMEELNIKE